MFAANARNKRVRGAPYFGLGLAVGRSTSFLASSFVQLTLETWATRPEGVVWVRPCFTPGRLPAEEFVSVLAFFRYFQVGHSLPLDLNARGCPAKCRGSCKRRICRIDHERMETSMPTTQNILDQHLKSFGENDLKGVLADYSPDALFFIPGTMLKGPDSIKPFFETLLSEFAKPGASFSMQHQCVESEYAYILWSAETADNSYEAATDTFVVREGKIVAQSFAARIIPKS
jgi:hypothetical protein